MNPARRFRFGEEPVATLVQSKAPLASLKPPPNAQATAPLVDFLPPPRTLPFREPPTAPMPPPEPLSPLALAPSPCVPARSRVSFRTAASLVLLVFDVLMLAYLLATWRP